MGSELTANVVDHVRAILHERSPAVATGSPTVEAQLLSLAAAVHYAAGLTHVVDAAVW